MPVCRKCGVKSAKVLRVLLILILGWSLVPWSPPRAAPAAALRLATGSPYELGLVDALCRRFREMVPCDVRVIKAASGRALVLLRAGRVDVALVHAPREEMRAVREGWALHRTYIGANEFVVVGPPEDPAGIRSCDDVVCAYRRIARRRALFLSRGDGSGTHRREMAIWARANIRPRGRWYRKSHAFMMASLLRANELGAYFMTDRSTYLVARRRHPELRLVILHQGDPRLINRYHALVANPELHPHVNYQLARQFVDFLRSKQGQRIIAAYGRREFGAPLYLPASHRFGEVIVFHAGSLTVPFQRIERLYEETHEGVDVRREVAGSRTCARWITDLHKPCDVFASADVEVITSLLFPEHADRCWAFATNRMVIAYTERSRYASEISPENWPEVLSRPGVSVGHSDPERDPCGYRALMVLQLAERFYGRPGLLARIEQRAVVRPKAVELIALLQTGNLDYAFEYESVAVQHGLRYLRLPRQIDLSDPSLNALYERASVRLTGKRPGERHVVRGKAICYGVALLRNAPHRAFAQEFLEFLLDPAWGLRVLERCGQRPIVPPRLIRASEAAPSERRP